MKIILIGAGNLATNLGKALFRAGNDIVQVFSRTMESASMLAHLVGADPVNNISEVRPDADLYIVSVKDSVLPSLLPPLCEGKKERVFVHTAGSMSMAVFEGVATHYGVIYPMQTFSKQKEVDFAKIPCFLEANDEQTLEFLEGLTRHVSDRIYRLSSEDRKYLHLSAVFACNFVNHCYAVSQDILERHGIPFEVMLPLIEETADKVHELKPVDAQTGPAVRYDENVIQAQSLLLKDNPSLRDIYNRMSMSIHKMSKR